MNRFTLFITLLLASIGIGWAQGYTPVGSLQMSTDANKIYYRISSPRGGYLVPQNGSLVHINDNTEASFWYLESAGEIADGVLPVKVRNASTNDYLQYSNNWTVGSTEATIYLRTTLWPGNSSLTTANGIVISPQANGTGNSIDANNSNTGTGKYGNSAADGEGTSWYFASLENAYDNVKIGYKEIYDRCKNVSALFTVSDEIYNAVAQAQFTGTTINDYNTAVTTLSNTFTTGIAAIYATANNKVVTIFSNQRADDKAGFISINDQDQLTLRGGLNGSAQYGDLWTAVTVEGQAQLQFHQGDKYIQGNPGLETAWTVGESTSAGNFFILGDATTDNNTVSIGTTTWDNLGGNSFMHASGNTNKVVPWKVASNSPASGWIIADESEAMDKAAMLIDYRNQLAAMNAFPAGTFNTEGISIAEITAATPIADITSAAATVPAAMATAAASADGKVVAFKNGSKYIADATGNSNLGTATSLTPGAGWLLKSQGNQSNFYLKNVLTGRYIGKNNPNQERATVPIVETTDEAASITFDFNTGILISTNEVYQHQTHGAQSYLYNSDSNITIWGRKHDNSQWTAEAVTVPTAVTVTPDALTLTIGETPANNTLTGAATAAEGSTITAGFDAIEWTAGEGLNIAEVADQPSQRTVTLADNAAAGSTAKVTVASTLKGLNLAPAEATVTINAASPLLPLVSTEGNEHYYAIKAIRNTSQNGLDNSSDLTGSYIRPTNDETALTRQNAIDDYAVMIFETAEGVEVPAGFSMAVKIKNIKTGKYFGGTISNNQLNLTDAAGATTWYLTTGAASANGTDYEGVMMANLAQSGNNYLESGAGSNIGYWQPNTMGSLWTMEPETIPSGVTIALGKQELLTSTEAQTVGVTATWTPDNLNDAFKTLTYAVTTGEGDNKAKAAGFTVADGNLTVPANAAAGTYTVTATTFNGIEATATLTITDRVLDVTEIALDADASAGITDGTVTLGAQTGTATWIATDVTLAFTVKVSASSKTPEASEFTVTSNNAAVAIAETDAVAITGPDADGAYTLTVKATATAPTAADAPAVLSIAYSGAHSPFTQTITVAKPAVNVTEVVASPATATVNLTKTADGTIGASAEQTATFVITTDGPTNMPDILTQADGSEGITVSVLSTVSLKGASETKTVGTEFEMTVTYTVEADAPANGTLTLKALNSDEELIASGTLDITVVTPVTGISAEAAATTIILGENGEATTTISGTISPEAANFTADQISATANKTEGMAFGDITAGTANSFTIPVTATKAGTYEVTVAYKNGDETISAPVIITVTAPAPEEGITVEAPTETLPESVAVEVAKPVAGEAQAVAIAFNNPEEQCRIELSVADEGVNIRTFYEIEYAANNPNGESIEAYLMTTNDGASSVILTNKEGTAVPFNTVIKVVEKNVANRAAGDAVIVINASINAAEIESVTLNGGRPIEVYLNQTLTLTAATEPASDNEVTYTVTDSKGNLVEPTAPGQYVFTVAGTYTVTATVAGTVPAVTTTTIIRAINATGNPGQGVSGIEAVNADAAEGRATIYDLTGRRLTRINAAGIYIVNGVKTLVR